MAEHRDPTGRFFRTYEVDANDLDLYQGDRVAPGFEIGTDIHSGATVYAESEGIVAGVYYNTMNDSYLLVIIPQKEGIDNDLMEDDHLEEKVEESHLVSISWIT